MERRRIIGKTEPTHQPHPTSPQRQSLPSDCGWIRTRKKSIFQSSTRLHPLTTKLATRLVSRINSSLPWGRKKECRKSFSEGQTQRGDIKEQMLKKWLWETRPHSRRKVTKDSEDCETPVSNHKPYQQKNPQTSTNSWLNCLNCPLHINTLKPY